MPPVTTAPSRSIPLVAASAGLACGVSVAWAHWLDASLVVAMTAALGLALAALLVVEPRGWPIVLVTIGVAMTGAGWAWSPDLRAAAAPAVTAIIGSAIAAPLLRVFSGGRYALRRVVDVVALAIVGAIGACAGAAAGVAVTGTGPRSAPLWETASRAGLASWVGVMVMTPLVLSWVTHSFVPRSATRREAVLLGCCTITAAVAVFGVSSDPRSAVVLPALLLWAAVRFRMRGVSSTLVAMLALADWAVARGAGPFPGITDRVPPDVLTLQALAVAALLTLLLLAAALDERDVADARRQIAVSRFRRAFECSPVGIAITTPDGVVTDANRALCAMLGYPRAQLVGTELEAFRSPDESTGELRLSQLTMSETGEPLPTERRYVSAHGERVCAEVTQTPVRGPDGATECEIVLLDDVTLRKDLEEQVLHSQKMDAVGRLAGGIAHDFNNLLAVMRGHAELLEDDLAVLEQARARIASMQRATDRATALTDDLLTFSRRSTDEPDVIDLHEVLTGAHDMLTQLAGPDIAIDLRLHATETRVEADPRRIEQVLVNLVVNAADVMPYGGRITLTTSNAQGTRPDGSPVRGLQIAVHDTGAGMTAAVQRRIFEPFFTTKPAGAGTGLGLSTAQSVVRRYGGVISVDSRLGEGTTFVITFPLGERRDALAGLGPSRAPAPEHPPRSPGRRHHPTETILVVDDEPEVRSDVADVLRGCGYRVLEAADGGGALDLVAATSEPIDLLVSDVVMPGIGGPELADRIRARSPRTEVLFVSGHAEIQSSSPCLRGATLLRKPVPRAALIAQVENTLDARGAGAQGSKR